MKKMGIVIGISIVILIGALLFVGFHPRSGFANREGRFIGCMVEKFADELSLSPKQKDQLTKIVDEARTKHYEMHALNAEVKTEILKELEKQEIDREKIDSLYRDAKKRFDTMYEHFLPRYLEFHKMLTSEQRKKLVAEIKRHHERCRKFHSLWGGKL